MTGSASKRRSVTIVNPNIPSIVLILSKGFEPNVFLLPLDIKKDLRVSLIQSLFLLILSTFCTTIIHQSGNQISGVYHCYWQGFRVHTNVSNGRLHDIGRFLALWLKHYFFTIFVRNDTTQYRYRRLGVNKRTSIICDTLFRAPVNLNIFSIYLVTIILL